MNNRDTFETVYSDTYVPTNAESYIATMAATLAGTVNITRCPTGNAPGATVTLGATATNTGNIGNNSFVILITAARVDNGVILAQGNSANINLAV